MVTKFSIMMVCTLYIMITRRLNLKFHFSLYTRPTMYFTRPMLDIDAKFLRYQKETTIKIPKGRINKS